MKKSILITTALVVVLCVSLALPLTVPATPQAEAAGASWWDDDWDYRQKFEIDGTDTVLTNYPMKLSVHTGSGASSSSDVYLNDNCETDLDDVRFISLGGTPLDYWIDPSTQTAAGADVWVEFNYIPTTEATFHIYYGYPSAASASDGNSTFQFFDDFDDGTIDTNKWTEIYEDNGDWVKEEGGVLKVLGQTSGFGNRADIWSGFLESDINVSVHARYNMTDPTNNGNMYLDHTPAVSNVYYYSDQATRIFWRTGYTRKSVNDWYASFAPTGQGVKIPSLNGSFHDVEKWFDSGKTGHSIVDGAEYTRTTTAAYDPAQTEYLRLRIKGEGNTNSDGCISDLYVDHIFARQYHETEPTFGDWGAETRGGLYGELDGTGGVTSLDKADLAAILLGYQDPKPASDVNTDGDVTSYDKDQNPGIDITDIILGTDDPIVRFDTLHDFSQTAHGHSAVYATPTAMPTSLASGWSSASDYYDEMASADETTWAINPGAGELAALQCKFVLDDDVTASSITSIGVTLAGYAETADDELEVYIWDEDDASAWLQIGSDIVLASSLGTHYANTFYTSLTFESTYGIEDYINGNDEIYIMFIFDSSYTGEQLTIDYVQLEVSEPGS